MAGVILHRFCVILMDAFRIRQFMGSIMGFKGCARLCLLALLAVLMACGRQKEQQRNFLTDLEAMQKAAIARQEVPPPSEIPGHYGKGEPVVKLMYEHYVKLSELNREFMGLVQETEYWISPGQWKDREKVKTLRRKAERLVIVVDGYTEQMDETTGEKAMNKLRSYGLGSRLLDAYSQGLMEHSQLIGETNTLLEVMRGWSQRMAELLALVDEKLVKMDGDIPKFGTSEDAERYRDLAFKIEQEKRTLVECIKRYMKAYGESTSRH